MLSDNSSSVFDPLRAPLLDLESSEANVDSKDGNRSDIGVTLWRWWILLQYSLLTFNQVAMMMLMVVMMVMMMVW